MMKIIAQGIFLKTAMSMTVADLSLATLGNVTQIELIGCIGVRDN